MPPSNSASSSTPVHSIDGDSLLANTSAGSTAKRNSAAPHHDKVDAEKVSVCQDEAVFGPPSTHSFINRVIASIEPCSKASTPASKPASSKPFLNDPIGFTVANSDDVRLDIDALLLPEKKLADSLLETYWRYSHINFPVLHRPTFINKYNKLWLSTESFSLSKYTGNDILLLATINIVLAIACQRSEHCPANSRKRDAESLYRRSVRLISAETLDSYSFEIMQLFILRIIYLQYTSFASRCWSTLGIAQRVAHGLGLHKDAPESMGQLEREMRRRVWHVLVIMDKLASLDGISRKDFPNQRTGYHRSHLGGTLWASPIRFQYRNRLTMNIWQLLVKDLSHQTHHQSLTSSNTIADYLTCQKRLPTTYTLFSKAWQSRTRLRS